MNQVAYHNTLGPHMAPAASLSTQED